MSLLLWHELLPPVLSYLESCLGHSVTLKTVSDRPDYSYSNHQISFKKSNCFSLTSQIYCVFQGMWRMSINDPNSSSDKFFLSNHGNWNPDLNSFPFDLVQATQFVNDLAESCNFLWDFSCINPYQCEAS